MYEEDNAWYCCVTVTSEHSLLKYIGPGHGNNRLLGENIEGGVGLGGDDLAGLIQGLKHNEVVRHN